MFKRNNMLIWLYIVYLPVLYRVNMRLATKVATAKVKNYEDEKKRKRIARDGETVEDNPVIYIP